MFLIHTFNNIIVVNLNRLYQVPPLVWSKNHTISFFKVKWTVYLLDTIGFNNLSIFRIQDFRKQVKILIVGEKYVCVISKKNKAVHDL